MHCNLFIIRLGKHSSKNEKGTCAAFALNLAKKRHGATQIRVPQNKEPRHFLKMFKGTSVIDNDCNRT